MKDVGSVLALDICLKNFSVEYFFLIGLAKKFVGGFLQLLMENPQKNFLSPLDSKEIKPVNLKGN